MSAIFGEFAPIYRASGWPGVLALPVGEKWPPPSGFTGSEGVDPTHAQVEAWRQTRPAGNIGIRMPETCIGIDVDHYDKKKKDGTIIAKRGFDELTEIEFEVGVTLPRTWISSAKPAPSGVRWFRVPGGLRFVGELSDAIEILWHGYRYAVAPPSINPDTGTTYQWISPDGEVSERPPRPEDLPVLPEAWVTRCVDGRPQAEARPPVQAKAVPRGAPTRSGAVDTVMARPRSWSSAGRHPTMKNTIMPLVRLQHLGYPGAGEALDQTRDEFFVAVAGERRPAQKEWDDMVSWAEDKIQTTAPPKPILDYETARDLGRQKHRDRVARSLETWRSSVGLRGGRRV